MSLDVASWAAVNNVATPSPSQGHSPPSWPPPADWPVVIDAAGQVISRWGDAVWRVGMWEGKSDRLNFGDGRVTHAAPIDRGNADVLRHVVWHWLYGPRPVRVAGTMLARFGMIRGVFALCTQHNILATNLMRFPLVRDALPACLPPSNGDRLVTLLHDLYESRETLRFVLLDKRALTELEGALRRHETQQTPYIPPRIWGYQVTRLRECLDDFWAHRQSVADCFNFCVDAYAHNYGNLAGAMTKGRDTNRAPFILPSGRRGVVSHGPFAQTAERFGIAELLSRWADVESNFDVIRLTTYLRLVMRAGLRYLLNFSLMRNQEGMSLRADCLHVEKDERFGGFYVLQGDTTKTLQDSDARWPTSPAVEVAVDAMALIARLRMRCAAALPEGRPSDEEINNPFLITHAYEPWASGGIRIAARATAGTYQEDLLSTRVKLFDCEQLRITQQDLDVARLLTPTLGAEEFAVGKIWPLADHQLRRTGAVNMQASGLVSDSSLQYLLKHASRAMSLYYGQNYSRVRLNDEARALYVRTVYEVLSRELAQLVTNRFVSPHGEKRKEEIVRLITPNDSKKLLALAKRGEVAYRGIVLGGCANPEPCPFGGIVSVAHCGGGDSGKPCADVLYDREKSPLIRKLDAELDRRLKEAPVESPLRESLEAQKRSVRNYFDVIQPQQ